MGHSLSTQRHSRSTQSRIVGLRVIFGVCTNHGKKENENKAVLFFGQLARARFISLLPHPPPMSDRKTSSLLSSRLTDWTKEDLFHFVQRQSDKDNSFPFLMGKERHGAKAPHLLWIGVAGQYTVLDANSLLHDIRNPLYEDTDSISVKWHLPPHISDHNTQGPLLNTHLHDLLSCLILSSLQTERELHILSAQQKNTETVTLLRSVLDTNVFGALYVGVVEGKCRIIDTFVNMQRWYAALPPGEKDLSSHAIIDESKRVVDLNDIRVVQ